VDDVVATIRAAAAAPGVHGGEFLVGGEPATQRSLAGLVARAAGRRPPLLLSLPVKPARWLATQVDRARGFDRRAGWALAVQTLAREWTFSSARAVEVLRHRPRPLAQGVAETVEWLRSGER
jgi:nucleoside-diphosphate-sugar epimerase